MQVDGTFSFQLRTFAIFFQSALVPVYVMFLSPLQPLNALSPIEVTLLPIVTLVKPLQPTNALSSIYAAPIVTLISPVQSPKAPPPIDVILSGMITLVRLSQSPNALKPIAVTGLSLYYVATDNENYYLFVGQLCINPNLFYDFDTM